MLVTIDEYDDLIVRYVVNPLPAELSYYNFHPLEVVSRYRDSQLQLG